MGAAHRLRETPAPLPPSSGTQAPTLSSHLCSAQTPRPPCLILGSSPGSSGVLQPEAAPNLCCRGLAAPGCWSGLARGPGTGTPGHERTGVGTSPSPCAETACRPGLFPSTPQGAPEATCRPGPLPSRPCHRLRPSRPPLPGQFLCEPPNPRPRLCFRKTEDRPHVKGGATKCPLRSLKCLLTTCCVQDS